MFIAQRTTNPSSAVLEERNSSLQIRPGLSRSSERGWSFVMLGSINISLQRSEEHAQNTQKLNRGGGLYPAKRQESSMKHSSLIILILPLRLYRQLFKTGNNNDPHRNPKTQPSGSPRRYTKKCGKSRRLSDLSARSRLNGDGMVT